MKTRYLLVPALGLFAANPAMAQSSPVSNAVKGTMTQTPIAPPPPVHIPPPAPPPVHRTIPAPPPPPPRLVPRAVPVERVEFPRDPRLKNSYEAEPTPADYPLESWRNDEEGVVRYRVAVGADGEADDCTIVSSSGHPALDARTCEIILERGEFSPALKDAQTPIAGILEQSHYWRKAEPEFPAMLVTFSYVLDEKGHGTNCEVVRIEGDLNERMRRDIDRSMELNDGCPMRLGRRGVPYRDEEGVPVAKRVTVTFEVTVEDPPQ